MPEATFRKEALPQDLPAFRDEAEQSSEEEFLEARSYPFLLYVRSKLWEPALVLSEEQQEAFGASTRIAEFTFLQGGMSFISPVRKIQSDDDVDGVSIGRGIHNDIIVPVSSVSTDHALLRGTGSGEEPWTLIDQGARNGTFRNEDRLESGGSALINKKEYIRLGGNLIAWFLSAKLMYRVLRRPDVLEKFIDL